MTSHRSAAPLTTDQQKVVAEKLNRQPFKLRADRSEPDHEHCVFCEAELRVAGSKGDPRVQTEGYATPDGSLWVCTTCFDRLNPKYRWGAK